MWLTALSTVFSREGDKIELCGVVTIDNVVGLTQQGIALLSDRSLIIDLAKVTEMDSTIVSMLLEWLRVAHKNECNLQFINLPDNLRSLVQLYGVADVIMISAN